jgi:hypothetical protein
MRCIRPAGLRGLWLGNRPGEPGALYQAKIIRDQEASAWAKGYGVLEAGGEEAVTDGNR